MGPAELEQCAVSMQMLNQLGIISEHCDGRMTRFLNDCWCFLSKSSRNAFMCFLELEAASKHGKQVGDSVTLYLWDYSSS